MSRVRGCDTKPELIVRSALHKLGYRFRLHKKDLPGKPDIVLPKYRTVIFVHGCFWHRHKNCKYASMPKTNTDFWIKKLGKNTKRDKENIKALQQKGWKVIVVWQCELKNSVSIDSRIEIINEQLKSQTLNKSDL